MKLQKLKIHNIASIEDAEIDFEASPLAESELFLITGKTGSGKSTILDAICLALYASTPRLESTRIQGAVKDGEQDVSVDDARQLLRRGKGEGYVLLDFIGTDKIPYQAEWSVRRAYAKPDGRLQPKEWILRDLSANVSYTKESEVKLLMAGAIGLSFEQFCRTTMLAQGEFTRFLNSDDKDKAAILEKITGVSIYSEIGAAIYNITSRKQTERDIAKSLCESIEPAKPEEIEALNEVVAEAKEKEAALESRSRGISEKLTWLEQSAAVLLKISEAEAAVRVAKEKAESDEYKDNCSTVADWNASGKARDGYMALLQLTREKARLEEYIAVLKQNYQTLLNVTDWEKDQLQALKDGFKVLQDKLSTFAPHRDLYLNEQTVYADLMTLNASLSRMATEGVRLQEAMQNQKDLIAVKEGLQSAFDHAEHAFGEASESLGAAERSLEAFGIQTYRAKASELNQRKLSLADAAGKLSIYNRTHESFIEAKMQQAEIQQRLDSLAKESAVLSEQLAAAEIAKSVAEKICSKLERSVDDWAKAVRAQLSVGDDCPVCRRKIESLPAEAEMDQVYSVAYKEYEEAKVAFDQVQGKLNEVSANCKAFEVQLKTAQAAVQRLAEKVESDKANLSSSLEKVGLELSEGVELMLDRLVSDTESVIAQNSIKIQEGEKLDEEVVHSRELVENARSNKEAALKKLNDADSKIKAVAQNIATIEALIKDQKDTYDRTVVRIEASLAGFDGVDIDWKSSPKAYAAELKRLAGNYSDLCDKAREAEQNLKTGQTNYDALKVVIGQIATAMPEWADVKAVNKVSMVGALQKANAVLAECNTYREQLADKVREIMECDGLIKEYLESQDSVDKDRLIVLSALNAAQIAKINEGLEQTRASIVAATSALDEHNKTYKDLQERRPDITEEDTQESLKADLSVCADEIGELRESKGAAEQKLIQIAEQQKKQGEYENEFAILQADYDKWARLCAYFGDSKGAKFRKIAQSYILANLIRAANIYMQTLSDRYSLTIQPGEFVIMVEDAYQGFAKRAASTISGGESFLVSLSLALALSDIGHTLAVDILLIDEGFGTLSDDSLTKAINTLKTLHRKSGRKVGIISHVEELMGKVPVQIRVEQEANSSKSIINVV